MDVKVRRSAYKLAQPIGFKSVQLGGKKTKSEASPKPPTTRTRPVSPWSDTVFTTQAAGTPAETKPIAKPAAEEKKKEAPVQLSPEQAFFKSLTSNLSPEEVSNLSTKAAKSLKNSSKPGERLETTLAAHTYNYVKASLRASLPGVSTKQLKAKALQNPQLKGKVELLDTTKKFLRSEKAAGQEEVELARQRAERATMMRDWADGMAKMREENRLTFAKIHKIMADAWQSVSDISRSIHANRQEKANKHNDEYRYLITEVWPK